MNYLETFRAEAEKKVRPLADTVAKLTRQLESIRKRADDEKRRAIQTEADIADLKNRAGEALTDRGVNAFDRYKTSLKKLTALLATSREIIETFDREILPAKERELVEAKAALQAALVALVTASVPVCEVRMGELVGVVLRERDEFMSAADSLFGDYAADFQDANKFSHARIYPDGVHLRPDPYRVGTMIATNLEEGIYDPSAPRRGAFLVSAPPIAPVAETSLESTPTGQDAQDALGSTPMTAFDTIGPGGQGNAPRAPEAPPRPSAATEEAPGAAPLPPKRTVLTGIVEDPPDLDALDADAMDAEEADDLDDAAPPDAAEKIRESS